VQNTDFQYLRLIFQNLSMHNLKTNFDKIFSITKLFFADCIDEMGNFKAYPKKPKMSDCEIIALALTGESIGIDSENYFWKKLKTDYSAHFPNLIERSRFNRRRKRLYSYIQKLNLTIANQLNENENAYIVDSIPVPVCQIARERRSKICKEVFENAPDKGYSAVSKSYYFGYKLHLITSVRGVFQSMDMTKASVHDVHFLSDVKYSGLNNCVLLGDKGYLSKTHQVDLFTTCNVNLQTPKRNNQHVKELFPFVFKRFRKRIETLFSQLCDQFMLKRNYAKSFAGLAVRILSKVASITMLQYINVQNNKPINHLKFALAV
jgi:penicillin-binding protein-related factor A (putative recombinase)